MGLLPAAEDLRKKIKWFRDNFIRSIVDKAMAVAASNLDRPLMVTIKVNCLTKAILCTPKNREIRSLAETVDYHVEQASHLEMQVTRLVDLLGYALKWKACINWRIYDVLLYLLPWHALTIDMVGDALSSGM